MKDIWQRIADNEPINMATDQDFRNITIPEMKRSLGLCSKINNSDPYDKTTRALEEELFVDLPSTSNIIAPMQIDHGIRVKIGQHVFINHSFTVSAIAGIIIDDNIQIAPKVTILTVNHDLKNKIIVKCKPVHIKKGAWIGANATILPGVTIGENAVVGAAAVVTKDVLDNAVVVGNPAKVIKYID